MGHSRRTKDLFSPKNPLEYLKTTCSPNSLGRLISSSSRPRFPIFRVLFPASEDNATITCFWKESACQPSIWPLFHRHPHFFMSFFRRGQVTWVISRRPFRSWQKTQKLAKDAKRLAELDCLLGEIPTLHRSICGDARDLTGSEPNSVHLVLTSPPILEAQGVPRF